MYLTSREVALQLRIAPSGVQRLHKQGWLTGFKIGRQWRYILPKLPDAPVVPHIETVPVFSVLEAAEILGLKENTIRSCIHRGQIKTVKQAPKGSHTPTLISAYEIRKLSLHKAKRGRPTSGTHFANKVPMYSPVLMKWLRHWLSTRQTPFQVLDEMINLAVKTPNHEQRSRYVTELWDLFEKVNALLKEIEDGKAASSPV
jgi:hypothetical protein